MKRYIIGVLLVVILLLTSIIYKNNKVGFSKQILIDFPVERVSVQENNFKDENKLPQLYLYLFFSKSNCGDCLRITEVLNKLSENFIVRGMVFKEEYSDINDIRERTGAEFEIKPITEEYYRFIPNYLPTLYGVSEKGKVYFVISSIPGIIEYLKEYLVGFFYRSLELRISDRDKKI